MSEPLPRAVLRAWLADPLGSDVRQSIDKLVQTDDVQYVAVMPDVHLAGEVCVGIVLATAELIYPAAVGGDIGCGMAALPLDASADLLASDVRAARLLEALYERIPGNKHGRATMPTLPKELLLTPLSHPSLEKLKGRDGRVQLGTLGRGNHFLEFQADEQDRLWLMVHSGSRAMGQAITAWHLSRATPAGRNQLPALDAGTPEGAAYLHDVSWAARYARENRRAMIIAAAECVERLFGTSWDESTLVDTDHNHVRREEHFGHVWLVHRKGAQSARDGEVGIVPGSMGTASFHVTGRGVVEALASCSHGAGRRLSRGEARSRIGTRQLAQQMRHVWFDHRRADALRDEAPLAYKDVHAVMRAQKELVRIERQLRPLLSYKG